MQVYSIILRRNQPAATRFRANGGRDAGPFLSFGGLQIFRPLRR
jgi:hypothetical protein